MMKKVLFFSLVSVFVTNLVFANVSEEEELFASVGKDFGQQIVDDGSEKEMMAILEESACNDVQLTTKQKWVVAGICVSVLAAGTSLSFAIRQWLKNCGKCCCNGTDSCFEEAKISTFTKMGDLVKKASGKTKDVTLIGWNKIAGVFKKLSKVEASVVEETSKIKASAAVNDNK